MVLILMYMSKRLFIFSIALLLTLALGCTKQSHLDGGTGDAFPVPGEQKISIPCPLVTPATKALAGEMPLDYSTDESFGVYALYYPTGNFNGWERTPGSMTYIDGAEFSYDSSIDDTSEGSGAWSATPGYYWPKGGKMTFAAWSPYRAKDDVTALSYGPSGLQLTNFTTADKGSEQYDLLYSKRVYDKADCSGTSTQYDGIDLLFSHALSSLHFTACSSVSTAKIRISKIVIYDICKSGDFSENVSETPPSTYSSSPAWTLGAERYTEAYPLVVYENNLGIAAPPLPLQESTPLAVGLALPIPQVITSAKMKVYYNVQLGSAEPVPTVSQVMNLGSGTVSEWKRQTRYTYNLILGAQQIRFSVNVRGWSDSDNTDIQ